MYKIESYQNIHSIFTVKIVNKKLNNNIETIKNKYVTIYIQCTVYREVVQANAMRNDTIDQNRRRQEKKILKHKKKHNLLFV